MAGDLYEDALGQLDEQTPAAQKPRTLYDDAIDKIGEQDQHQQTTLRRSFNAAQQTTPDTAAEARRLGLKFGAPQNVVERNLDTYRQREAPPVAAIQKETPKLASFLETDDYAKVVHDDLEKMGQLEWIVTAPTRGVTQVINQLRYSELRSRQIMGGAPLTREDLDLMEGYRRQSTRDLGDDSWWRKPLTGTGQLLGQAVEPLKYSILGAIEVGAAGAAVGSVIPGPGTLAGGIAGAGYGAIVGSTYGIIKTTLEQEATAIADDLNGVTDEFGQPMNADGVRVAAILGGAINAGLEVAGMEAFLASIPTLRAAKRELTGKAITTALRNPTVRRAFTELGKAYGSVLTQEVAVEVAQQAVTMSSEELAKGYGAPAPVEGQKAPGNINLYQQPVVQNDNGTTSTVDSFSINRDGVEILLPHISRDGKRWTDEEAIANFDRTGKHLGKFVDAASATKFASQLHDSYAAGKYQHADKFRSPGDWWDELAQTTVQSAESFSLGVAFGPVQGFVQHVAAAHRASQNEEFFKALASGVKDTKTLERAPDVLKAYLAHATADGPVETLYSSAKVWEAYWTDQGIDPAQMAATVTGSADAYTTALAHDQDFAIKTSDYAVTIAPSAHNGFFSKELRIGGPNEYTWHEQEQLKTYVEQIMASAPAEGAAVDPMELRLTAKLTASGVPEETARMQARVMTALTNLATRAGEKPSDLFTDLDITGDAGAAAATPGVELNQDAKPTATFLAHGPDGPLYNISGGEKDRSTVSAAELEQLGIPVPETPPDSGERLSGDELRRRAIAAKRTQTAPIAGQALPGGTQSRLRALGFTETDIEALTTDQAAALLNERVGGLAPGAAKSDLTGNEAAQAEAAQEGHFYTPEWVKAGAAAQLRMKATPLGADELAAEAAAGPADLLTDASAIHPADLLEQGPSSFDGLAQQVQQLRLEPPVSEMAALHPVGDHQVYGRYAASAREATAEGASVEDFLDWQLPASQQAAPVQSALTALGLSWSPISVPTLSEALDLFDGDRLQALGESTASRLEQLREGEHYAATGNVEAFNAWFVAHQDLMLESIKDPTGEQLYAAVLGRLARDERPLFQRDRTHTGDQATSAELAAHGIAGVRYDDHGPNYVVFETPASDVTEFFQPAKLKSKAKAAVAKQPRGFADVALHLTPNEVAKLKRHTMRHLVALFKTLPADADFAEAALAGAVMKTWYRDATAALREVFGAETDRFVMLLAAMSPQVQVQDNLRHATAVWAAWKLAGEPSDADTINKIMAKSVRGASDKSVLDAWRNNAVLALTAQDPLSVVLSGPKVHSFARNLQGVHQELANDTWMANFALIRQTLFKGKRLASGLDPGKSAGYLAMNAKLRRVAATLTHATGEAWEPAEVQAAVWSWTLTLYQLAGTEGLSAEEILQKGLLTDRAILATPNIAHLLTNTTEVRTILEKAGYGKAIEALEHDVDPADRAVAQLDSPALADTGAPGGEGAARQARPVTLGLLRSARRLDRLRDTRRLNKSLKEDTTFYQDPAPLDDAALQAWAAGLKQAIGADLSALDVSLTFTHGDIKLNSIVVLRRAQRAGLGSEVMRELVKFADRHGKRILLTPAEADWLEGTTSKSRLVRFYKRFGFVENTGRHRDLEIGDTMYREPTVALAPGASRTYDTDLYGQRVSTDRAAAPDAAAPGNVDPAAALQVDDVEGDFPTRTQLVTHSTRELGTSQVSTIEDAATALAYIGRGAQERFDALVTDDAGVPLAVVGSFKGTVDRTFVHPDIVLAEAIRIGGAARIWFAHNHPSGGTTISPDDVTLETQLADYFRGSGITPMGLFAIGAGEKEDRAYEHYDSNRGSVQAGYARPPGEPGATVPVLEREFSTTDKLSQKMNGPNDAVAVIPQIARGQFGVAMLDTKHAVIGFLPIDPDAALALRSEGRLAWLYRALSISAPAAVVLHAPRQEQLPAAMNLANMFHARGVMVLDLITVNDLGAPASSTMALSGPLPLTGGFAQDDEAWFSRLTRAVEASDLAQGPGAQWKAQIKNTKGGISLDEFAFAKVGDLEDNRVYTKQEVLDYLSINTPTIDDVVYEGPTPQELREKADELWDARVDAEYEEALSDFQPEGIGRATAKYDEDDDTWTAYLGRQEIETGFATEEKAQDAADDARNAEEDSQRESFEDDLRTRIEEGMDRDDIEQEARDALNEGRPSTRYETYVEDGAKKGTYREAFVTMPARPAREIHTVDSPDEPSSGWSLQYADDDSYVLNNDGLPKIWQSFREAERQLGKLEVNRWKDGHDEYDDVVNPVVRIRFNERKTRERHRVMFLEEVQPPHADEFEKMPLLFQKNWRQIGFKWALRYAAEHGYEAIAWTPGKLQADRYSLEKKVDSIKWGPMNEDSIPWDEGARQWVTITMTEHGAARFRLKEDGTVMDPDGTAPAHWKGHHLADVLPREMSDQILAMRTAVLGQREGTIEGEGLKIGGEGLTRLYDVDFVNVLHKLPAVKALGGRVVKTFLPTGAIDRNWATGIYKHPADVGGAGRFSLQLTGGNLAGGSYATRAEAEDALAEWNKVHKGPGLEAPLLELTPALIKSLQSGQAMFQPARRGSIRFGADRQFLISFLEGADPSTFFHEMGHFFLVVFGDVVDRIHAKDPATLTDSQRALVADYEALLRDFKVTNKADIGTEHHEQFARTFEAYLREGVAPSTALEGPFARYRQWLVGVYPALESLQVHLTPEVKGVLDRLMASDKAIASAEAERSVGPMFTTAESAGMTPAQFSLYQKKIADAHTTARERLDVQLLADQQREASVEYAEARADIHDQVEAELAEQPAYRALAAMRSGQTPTGDPLVDGTVTPPLKLSKAILLARYGVERLRSLPRPYIFTTVEGLDPDTVASMFGFSSGDELLTAIAGVKPFAAAVEEETGKRAVAQLGNLLIDGRLDELAKEAVANEDRDFIIRAELAALAQLRRTVAPFVTQAVRDERKERAYERRWFDAERKLELAQQKQESQDVIDALTTEVRNLRQKARGGAATVRRGIPSAEVVREAARARIRATPIQQLRPQVFWSAARRSGNDARDLAARQDLAGAMVAAENELINLALYREAARVRDDVRTRADKAAKLATAKVRARLGLAGGTLLDQVDGVLDRFEFATVSQKTLERRSRIRDYIAAMTAQGLPLTDLPSQVVDDARRTNWKELTVDDFLGVTDGLQQLVHLARLKNKLLKNADARDFDVIRTEGAASIRQLPAKPKLLEIRSGDEARRRIGNWFASHTKIATLARALDNHVDGGWMWEHIIRPINAAADDEVTRKQADGTRYQAIIDTAYPGRELATLNEKLFIPAINASLSKEARLAYALNWGNQTSRDRVLNDPHRKFTPMQIDAILDTLDERDWHFVQATFDFVNTYWDEIAAKSERLTGLVPEKVEAIPIDTKFGMFNGGYYPLAYDGRFAPRAEQLEMASEAKLAQAGAYVSSTTRRGHEQTRLENVKLPIRLELGVMFAHVEQVVHDLTHHEMLLDVTRLLRDPEIQAAILETKGDIVYEQFTHAVQDIALGSSGGRGRVTIADNAATFARTGTQIAGMALNLWTAAQQPLGLFNGMSEVGPVWVARGMKRWLRDAATMEHTVDWIVASSPMMAGRFATATQDLNDLRAQLRQSGGWWDRLVRRVSLDTLTQQTILDGYLWHIGLAQRVADVPTWLGAYEKAMAGGELEDRAFALADQAVLNSQGGGQVKDLAKIQRGGPIARLFLTFYSYGNTVFNATADKAGATNFKSPTSVLTFLGHLSLLYALPALGTIALSRAFGKSGGDGDTPDEFVKDVGREILSTALNTMMYVRELGALASEGTRGYEGPAGARLIQLVYNFSAQVKQGEVDEALLKAANSVGGVLFRYPAAQVQRTVDGWVALEQGRTSNPLALMFGGPPKGNVRK